jgi:hypothetical protein
LLIAIQGGFTATANEVIHKRKYSTERLRLTELKLQNSKTRQHVIDISDLTSGPFVTLRI